ncbi:MAG: acyl carrier protein [Pseudomonadota bacterium]|nr:acyl carrier protein [Pseudomonadota bacterium]
MTDTEIRAGIAEVARAHLGYEGELLDDTSLVEALRLDSVRLLTLVAELENHFRVVLEDGDEAGIEHVADLVAVLRRRIG